MKEVFDGEDDQRHGDTYSSYIYEKAGEMNRPLAVFGACERKASCRKVRSRKATAQ